MMVQGRAQHRIEWYSNFWDVSRILLEKIKGPSYLHSKEKQNEYLVKHPYVAKKLDVNTVSVEKKG